MLSPDKIKQLVGREAVSLVQQDMIIGIGSGSTVFYFIEALAQKVREGFNCRAVPTSSQTLSLSEKQGISMLELNEADHIDITIDGADEMDEQLQLIKGGGAALLQEKMVASASEQLVIIADNGKLKKQLGSFPLPVEVITYGWKNVQQQIQHAYKIDTALRMKEGKPLLTDHGHYILDCKFQTIQDPAALNTSLHLIPGVVETGLFINMCDMAIIGNEDGSIKRLHR
jgi:ribose 5-phosphate isomerase A